MFIDCSGVSNRWHWSVNLYKIRKETAIYKRETIQNDSIHKIEDKHTKQVSKHKKNIKNMSN